MKPLVLGLDLASTTGWALWDSSKHLSSIQCGFLQCPEKIDPSYKADQMGLKITDFVRRIKKEFGRSVDIAVIEEAAHTNYSGVKSTISSCMIHGAVYGTLSNHGILWGTIPVATWRPMFFGKGFNPPQKQKKKDGKTVLVDDWKQAAINACDQQGIVLPTQKTKARDAAEAVAVAVCWRKAKVHADRYQNRLMELLQGRNEQREAA